MTGTYNLSMVKFPNGDFKSKTEVFLNVGQEIPGDVVSGVVLGYVWSLLTAAPAVASMQLFTIRLIASTALELSTGLLNRQFGVSERSVLILRATVETVLTVTATIAAVQLGIFGVTFGVVAGTIFTSNAFNRLGKAAQIGSLDLGLKEVSVK